MRRGFCTLVLFIFVRKRVFGSKTGRVTFRLSLSFFSVFESAAVFLQLILYLGGILAITTIIFSTQKFWPGRSLLYAYARGCSGDSEEGVIRIIYSRPVRLSAENILSNV